MNDISSTQPNPPSTMATNINLKQPSAKYEQKLYNDEHLAAAITIQNGIRDSPRFSPTHDNNNNNNNQFQVTESTVGVKPSYSTSTIGSNKSRRRKKHNKKSSKRKSKRGSPSYDSGSGEYSDESSSYSESSSSYSESSSYSDASSDSDYRRRRKKKSKRRGRHHSSSSRSRLKKSSSRSRRKKYKKSHKKSSSRSRRSLRYNSEDSYSSGEEDDDEYSRNNHKTKSRKPKRPHGGKKAHGGKYHGRKVRKNGDMDQSSTEITDRKTLRKLNQEKRNAAVRKIQALARMWLARKQWLGLSTEILFGWRKAGLMIVDDLVEEVVVDGLIPDVLIEIFSHAGGRGDPFATNPMEDRVAWGVYNMLVDEVVEDLTTVVVKKEVRSFVTSYLQVKEERKDQYDPIEQCSRIVLTDSLTEFVNEIVKESVSSMVSEYLFLQNYEEFLHASLDPILKEVVYDSIYDFNIETYVEGMLDDFFRETCTEIAKESMVELKDIIHQERLATQYSIISKTSERIVETMTLRMLALTLATNGETIIMKDRMSRLLDTMVIRGIYSKLTRVERVEKGLQENVVLRHLHQELTANIGIDVLLGDLKQQLAIDEARIDAEEMKRYT